jgi:hypothetical protein
MDMKQSSKTRILSGATSPKAVVDSPTRCPWMLIVLGIVSLGAVLAPQARAAGYLTPLQTGIPVTEYMVNNNIGSGGGGITIWVSGISNPDGCTGLDKVHIKASAAGYKEMVAAVMSAVALGKKIGFYGLSCETLPFWGGSTTYPIVSDLWVVN